MGCAINENQQQQQQSNNERCNGQQTDLFAGAANGCPRRLVMATTAVPMMPLQPTNSQKASHLKESHSALVKILESAPLNKSNKTSVRSHHQNQSQPQAPPQHINTVQSPQLRSVAIESLSGHQSSMSPPPSSSTSPTAIVVNHSPANSRSPSCNGSPITSDNSRPTHHHHYRKRAKHLTICDTASSGEEEESSAPSVNKRQSSSCAAAEMICPWKKTRIAREWRQKQNGTADSLVSDKMVIDEEEDDGVEGDADVNDDDAYDSSCECEDKTIGWRRASSESSGCDDNHHSPKHSSQCGECSDSSDGVANISELCKKFNDNLSEKDVNIKNTIDFDPNVFLCLNHNHEFRVGRAWNNVEFQCLNDTTQMLGLNHNCEYNLISCATRANH